MRVAQTITEERNPKYSERNQVIWLDRKFIKNQKLSSKQAMWLSRHWKISTIIGAIGIIFAFVVPRVSSISLRISTLGVLIIFFAIFLPDAFLEFRRYRQYYNQIINDGGVIIEPYNNKLLGGSTAGTIAMQITYTLLILSFIFIETYFSIVGIKTISSISNMSICLINLPVQIISLLGSYRMPFIFLDIDRGMVFGGNLFSYASLSGFTPVGERNGFELHCQGKVVAKGRMLPEDRMHLLQILEIRRRYEEISSS